jgi:YVTN family beta-propeller protein
MINKQKLHKRIIFLISMILVLVNITDAAPFAYITNSGSNTVSVIDVNTGTVTANVIVGLSPYGVALSPDGTKVYVTNQNANTVSVINTTTNTVTATVPVGNRPTGIAVSPDGTKVYVANQNDNTVSVVDTSTNSATTINGIGSTPWGITVSPNGANVYVTCYNSNNVYVINTATNSVTTSIGVGAQPEGIAVSLDGMNIYVACWSSNNVYVINTATNGVTTSIGVGSQPEGIAFSPDGMNIYVACYSSNNVYVINTTTNNVNTVSVGSNPVSFGQFIGKLTPTITWSNPANITYGTPLSNIQLDATTSDPISGVIVPGTFVYTPPLGTILNAGTQLLNTIFTPTNTVKYNKASATVLVNVTNHHYEYHYQKYLNSSSMKYMEKTDCWCD